MTLQSRPKVPGLNRTIPPEETLRRARPVAQRLGVTRVSDITGLDRVGIPTFSAIVPDSADLISVYTGKGLQRVAAHAGALMEAIERQSALRAQPPRTEASFTDLARTSAVVHPSEIVTALGEHYRDDAPQEWVSGFDLLRHEPVFVPAVTAGYRWALRLPPALRYSTTHGLAAGNCLEEAVAQALCEWIERDAWTIAELLCHWRPRAIWETLHRSDPGVDFVDDQRRFPLLDLAGVGGAVEALLTRFHRAGLRPLVREITSDIGVPVVLATVAADEVHGFPQVHLGVGAHPDFRIAAARALTEAAQSRCGDIQAVREDIEQSDSEIVAGHTRRAAFIDRRRWILGEAADNATVRHSLPAHDDVLDDLHLLFTRLRNAGIQRVIVVDLSPPDTGLHVVRVIVPGLETWIVDQGRLGARALEAWKRA